MAPGSRKDHGFFSIPADIAAQEQRPIILCESAIDAISCYQLHLMEVHTPCICISTAGVRSSLPWVPPLIARGYDIFCGFDTDQPGETVACQLISRHRSIQRLRPAAHDWNDALTASR